VEDASAWTPPATHELSTRDGRVLRYCLYGPQDGRPVVDHDGTPGTRFASEQFVDLITRCGLRVVLYDRPGYGGSTRQVGRSIADVADDVALLADALGWDRFAVSGGSGGAPHALACAVRLADRVTRCAAVACPAPYVAGGEDGPDGLGPDSWFAGMSPGNIAEYEAALSGETGYRPLVQRLGQEAMTNAVEGNAEFLSGYDIPESDLAEIRRRLAEPSPGRLERARARWLDSTDGWIDDVMAMVRPWGVDLAQLEVPVTVWYGPDDNLCPRSHTDWLLSHLPGVQGREVDGGHIVSLDSQAEVYRWVSG
jgi:pimeloyl-ACP methyl ester carboxylesterase